MIRTGDFKQLWRSGEQDPFAGASSKVAELGRSVYRTAGAIGKAKVDYGEVERYREQFVSAFGKERTSQAFGAIDARLAGKRSVRYRDIKSAFDQARVYEAPERAARQLVKTLPPQIEVAARKVRNLERQRAEIAGSAGHPADRERKLGHIDKALERERQALAALKSELKTAQSLVDALKHPPEKGEDRIALYRTIRFLAGEVEHAEAELERAARGLRHLQLRDAQRGISPGSGATSGPAAFQSEKDEQADSDDEDGWSTSTTTTTTSSSSRRLIQDEEEDAWSGSDGEGSSTTTTTTTTTASLGDERESLKPMSSGAISRSLDDDREAMEATTVEEALQRFQAATAELHQAKADLAAAQQRLQSLDATPEVLRARQDIMALGQDPRLYRIMKENVPAKVALSGGQERKANWQPSSSVPWALEKGTGVVAGPALLPLNGVRTVQAEKLEQRMIGVGRGSAAYPFAQMTASNLENSAAQDKWKSGFAFAIGYAFAAPSMLPTGGTVGGALGNVASSSLHRGGASIHQLVGTATSDATDLGVGEGIDRTVGHQLERVAEESGGSTLMPVLPIVTPGGGTVYVDLNDTEVLKAFLQYLWPGQDPEARWSDDDAVAHAEERRLQFRQTYFGAEPREHYAHEGRPDQAAFDDQVKAIRRELDSGRAGPAIAKASPLLVLYVALNWIA